MKDDKFPSGVFPALKKFVCKYILPELLTWKLKQASRSCDSEEVNEELYCICHKPESGHMIVCGNSNHSIKWFHYVCVGINVHLMANRAVQVIVNNQHHDLTATKNYHIHLNSFAFINIINDT